MQDQNTDNKVTPSHDSPNCVEILPDTDPVRIAEPLQSAGSANDFSANYKSIYDTAEDKEKNAAKSAAAAEKYRNAVLIASEQKKARRIENKSKTVFTALICVACMLISIISGSVSAKITFRRQKEKDALTSTTPQMTVGEALFASVPYTLPPPSQTEPLTSASETHKEDQTTQPTVPTAVANTNAAVAKTAKEIYEESVRSVVGVKSKITISSSLFGQSYVGEASGSGFIVSEDGYILTNYHVVDGGSDITVSFYDDTTLPATLVGFDADNDIAVLKTNTDNLKPVKIGNSDELSVGDTILVIGNPLSLSYSLSSGVVSALNRTLSDEGTQINMFQTDAAINSGNSGGPAFNMDGEVIGIATSKYADSTIEGLSFCIPIDDVKQLALDIIQYGHVKDKAMLSVSAQTLNASMARRYNLVEGVYVVALGYGGAAEQSGIQKGDVITAINGEQTKTVPQLKTLLKKHKAGDTVTLSVYRGGTTVQIEVITDEYVPASARTTYTNVYDF